MISSVTTEECAAMGDATMPVEKMDELLRFLPLFEVADREYVKDWGGGEMTAEGAITVPYPIYCDDVLEFFALAGQTHWSDFDYDPREAHEMLGDDVFISRASLDQLRTMLTYCVRGERFADGHWAHMLESGRIVALLRRLAALRSEAEGAATPSSTTPDSYV
jgi:hypothetical protein